MNIIDKNIDKRYNHYRRLKNLKKKSKTEKIVLLILMNVCIYSYLMPILNAKSSIVIHSAVETVQADELPDPCYMDVVECVGTAVVDREDKPAKGESIGRERIEALIASSFGEEAENAKKVFMCESHYNPKTIGDTKIAFWKNGHLYGRSIGIAQIRMLPGRTDNPEVYEKELMNPEKNIIEAKKIFDSQGWGAWYNCAKMNNIM